ncbi:MAG: hypothetical protein JWP29_5243, partial [Rhodoferax sp.]|nr:hypothetical protein [Rhodoferax sp.]
MKFGAPLPSSFFTTSTFEMSLSGTAFT